MSIRKAVVILTTLTRPTGEDNTRFELACELARNASTYGHVVRIREKFYEENFDAVLKLRACGAIVDQQTGTTPGEDRRTLFRDALKDCEAMDLDGVLWTEEKPYMAEHVSSMLLEMRFQNAVACIPRRSERSFRRSWPLFQYHSESCANEVYRKLYGQSEDGPYDIMHGPVYFAREAIQEVLDFDPEKHDIPDVYIQHFVPAILMAKGHKVATYEVDGEYPPAQRAEEEGPKFIEMVDRRLGQLKTLIDGDRKIYEAFFKKAAI